MKLAISLALALLAGCLDAHPAGVADVTQNDCQTCHQADFQRAMADTMFPHTAGFAGACAACHSPQAGPTWPFVHPSDPFPTMTGVHAMYFADPYPMNTYCHQCHDANTSADWLQNIDCVTACHAKAHHQDSNKAGCLDCHPDGRR